MKRLDSETKSSRQILQISYMERSNSCMGRSDFWWGRNDRNSFHDIMQVLRVSNCKQGSSCELEVRDHQISLAIVSFSHQALNFIFLQLFVDSMLCKTKASHST